MSAQVKIRSSGSKQRLSRIGVAPLTREAFAPFGDVISALPKPSHAANQGTAQRSNNVATITNLRTGPENSAVANLCVFRCTPPQSCSSSSTAPSFTIKLLERHPYSTQFFVPMTAPSRTARGAAYLVIVCGTDPSTDTPDWETLRAFVARSDQGVNYREACWHHPMVALGDEDLDFCVMVYERGDAKERPDEDCEESFLGELDWITVDLES
ncbi:Ureidoglycolate lyase [Thoreauomyces humboldtii]|nr:Ureidoglycolate lyase [Thoreauomyces humboldtii]